MHNVKFSLIHLTFVSLYFFVILCIIGHWLKHTNLTEGDILPDPGGKCTVDDLEIATVYHLYILHDNNKNNIWFQECYVFLWIWK